MELPERVDTVRLLDIFLQERRKVPTMSPLFASCIKKCESLIWIEVENLPFLEESKVRVHQITQMNVKERNRPMYCCRWVRE